MTDKRVTRLVSVQGFNQAFEEQIKYHKTMADAFYSVNELYAKYYGGEGRYSSFDSFRMSRKHYLLKLKKQS
jgi:hypothetical protein